MNQEILTYDWLITIHVTSITGYDWLFTFSQDTFKLGSLVVKGQTFGEAMEQPGGVWVTSKYDGIIGNEFANVMITCKNSGILSSTLVAP